jgi:NADH:ubiquinone oxidoreductase subunit E
METQNVEPSAPPPVAPEDVLPADWTDRLDRILDAFRGRPGSLIPVMQEAQRAMGYLPLAVQEYLADGLNINASEVYGVATFYAFFRLKPVGRHVCKVCLGTACYVKGGEKIYQQLQKDLGVKHGETTVDRRFTLEGVRCVGACGLAPVVIIDEEVHREVDVMGMREILGRYA